MAGSNLKKGAVLQTRPGNTHTLAGLQNLRLLYPVVSKLDMTGDLILLFNQRGFWVVPKRALGEKGETAAWFEQPECKCEKGKQAYTSMSKTE